MSLLCLGIPNKQTDAHDGDEGAKQTKPINNSNKPKKIVTICGETPIAKVCQLISNVATKNGDIIESNENSNHDASLSLMLVFIRASWNNIQHDGEDMPSMGNLAQFLRNESFVDEMQLIKDISMYSVTVDGGDNEREESDVDDNMYLAIEKPDGLQCPATLPALKVILTNTATNQSRTTEYATISPYVLKKFLSDGNDTAAVLGGIHTSVRRLLGQTKTFMSHKTASISERTVLALPTPTPPATLPPAELPPSEPIKLFIAGDRSQVGKSSVCLGLLGTLLHLGYQPHELAYIKPATQCEATQVIQLYCQHVGIACQPIGPIVYYKGFTRKFLEGHTETSYQLLQNAKLAVEEISRDKRVVVIDGVGYPAVGSICGTDNASVAQICDAPVLLVGKSGVGDAIDSYNLNAAYFQLREVVVLGGVFNRLKLTGYYSLENCKTALRMYFSKFGDRQQAFGFLPELEAMNTARDESSKISSDAHATDDEKNTAHLLDVADQFIETFRTHVDVPAILSAAKTAMNNNSSRNTHSPPHTKALTKQNINIKPKQLIHSSDTHIKLTREQIESAASAAGAAGG